MQLIYFELFNLVKYNNVHANTLKNLCQWKILYVLLDIELIIC
jgi:hypothetical protein